MQPVKSLPRLATVDNVPCAFPEARLTKATIRSQVFKSKDRFNSRGDKIPGNGLAQSGAIIRHGRKILIDLDRYGAWLSGEGG